MNRHSNGYGYQANAQKSILRKRNCTIEYTYPHKGYGKYLYPYWNNFVFLIVANISSETGLVDEPLIASGRSSVVKEC